MVTSPPNISTMSRAEVASVVRCGSKVGGSTKSCTNRAPRRGPPLPALSVGAAGSVAAGAGVAAGSGGDVGAVDSPPPQAAASSREVKARITPIQCLGVVIFIRLFLSRPGFGR